MSSSSGNVKLLIDRLEVFIENDKQSRYPDWRNINWSHLGPSALFDEFKRVASNHDYLVASQLACELELGKIQTELSNLEVQQEKAIQNEIKRVSKSYINQAYAYQERDALVRLSIGKLADDIAELRVNVERVKQLIDIVKRKAKLLSDFKQDARVVVQLMSFGNQLGELKS